MAGRNEITLQVLSVADIRKSLVWPMLPFKPSLHVEAHVIFHASFLAPDAAEPLCVPRALMEELGASLKGLPHGRACVGQ